jgi:RNA recognition motif-containing protein
MRENLERETGKGGSSRAASGKKNGYFHHLDKITTSFFITNFPDDATTGDLWKLFLKFGKVGEVYVPKKLDKRGRRFGFVKFKDVGDVEVLSEKLRDVWIGSFKLWVNRSRFGRDDSKEVMVHNSAMQQTGVNGRDNSSGKSFRNVLLKGRSLTEPAVLKVPVNEALCKELQGSVVGILTSEKEVS